MRRRTFVLLGAAAVSSAVTRAHGQSKTSPATLLDIPLQVQGAWGQSSSRDVAAVVARMRTACLSGIGLLSDRQPSGLRIENHGAGNPAIWLHDDRSTAAWIIVNVGPQDWSKLAYQFGHELGHVLANSWDANSKPANPCQWLEEALVEAFSLRGLGKLADSWAQRPVFPNDAPFANAIRRYRRSALAGYEEIAPDRTENRRLDKWFRQNRLSLESSGGLGGPAEAAVPALLQELEGNVRCVEDLGALNRWPERSSVPVDRYLALWERSCGEIGSAGRLPARIRDLLDLA